MSWLRRNSGPIMWVLLASALVIGAFELLDAVVDGGGPANEDEAPAVGLSVAGLIKVTLFLGVGFALTSAIRRRQQPAADDS